MFSVERKISELLIHYLSIDNSQMLYICLHWPDLNPARTENRLDRLVVDSALTYTFSFCVGMLLLCGALVNGPYALITTAVSADLVRSKASWEILCFT